MFWFVAPQCKKHAVHIYLLEMSISDVIRVVSVQNISIIKNSDIPAKTVC